VENKVVIADINSPQKITILLPIISNKNPTVISPQNIMKNWVVKTMSPNTSAACFDSRSKYSGDSSTKKMKVFMNSIIASPENPQMYAPIKFQRFIPSQSCTPKKLPFLLCF
jgi:hypothetical protein